MDFDLYMPAKVVSGENCVERNSGLLRQYGKHCGIVTGGSSAKKSGALEEVLAALKKENIDFCLFEGIKPNPLTTDCYEAGCLFREKKVDFVIGIGGGSALDSAKAVAAYTPNPHLVTDDIYSLDFKCPPLPIVLVGTSAGTGSEVSFVSVLTDTRGRKRSIKGNSLYASLAFADSRYTHSVPYEVTVSTALDALAHAVEGFMTHKCTDIPTVFAERGIPMVWQGLLWLLENKDTLPSPALREQLYYGSLYAGIVLNACGTVFPHPMGYVLTENYGVPHGKACATFIPALIDRCLEYKPTRVQELFSMIGETKESFCKKIEALTALPSITMTRQEAKAFSERWTTPPNNFNATPGGFLREDGEELLLKLFVK